MIFKEGWRLVMGLFCMKCEGEVSDKVVFKEGLSFIWSSTIIISVCIINWGGGGGGQHEPVYFFGIILGAIILANTYSFGLETQIFAFYSCKFTNMVDKTDCPWTSYFKYICKWAQLPNRLSI